MWYFRGSARLRVQDDCARSLARVANGDKQALEILYARYATPLLRYLLTLTLDRRVAEEILQDTFVAVWRGAGTFAGHSSVRSWIFGIARRQAGNTLRKLSLPFCDDYELSLLPGSEVEPEEAVLISAGRDELMKQIGRLGQLHREVLVLVFIYELSYVEASRVLDVPIGTVKSRLNHAKRTLRMLLQAAKRVDE